MVTEGGAIELLCRANCPFERQCGWSYDEGESACIESVNSTIEAINLSLAIDPALDPERPTKKYSEVRKGKIVYEDKVPITAMLKMKTRRGIIPVRLGEIRQGEVLVYAHSKEIYERIKNTVPPVIKKINSQS